MNNQLIRQGTSLISLDLGLRHEQVSVLNTDKVGRQFGCPTGLIWYKSANCATQQGTISAPKVFITFRMGINVIRFFLLLLFYFKKE